MLANPHQCYDYNNKMLTANELEALPECIVSKGTLLTRLTRGWGAQRAMTQESPKRNISVTRQAMDPLERHKKHIAHCPCDYCERSQTCKTECLSFDLYARLPNIEDRAENLNNFIKLQACSEALIKNEQQKNT